MEGDVEDDGFYSDEDWPSPIDEPRGTQYRMVKIFRCKARQEWQLEDWFEYYCVAVDGVIYQRGEWNDPTMRCMKDQFPPWLQPPVAGSGWGRRRDVSPPPGRGIVLDERKIFLEEQERMEKNKETRFVFLVEEGRRAEAENDFPDVGAMGEAEDRRAEEARREAEDRRAEEEETNQQEVLYELDYQGETAETGGENDAHPGDELQAVVEATGNIDLNGGFQHEAEAMTEEGDNTIQQTEPSKKHSGDALQSDMTKRPKMEEEITNESGADAHSTEVEEEPDKSVPKVTLADDKDCGSL